MIIHKGGVLMAYIKSKLSSQPAVNIPYWFITDYMPKALSGDLKVYLYLFALSHNPDGIRISLEEVSRKLDMLYSELLQALRHWHKKKVLCFEETSSDEFYLEFYLDKPETIQKIQIAPSVAPVQVATKPAFSKTLISQSRPEYSTEEINVYMKDSTEVTNLFKIAEQYLGRLLTMTDQKILFSFYDWLHMPFDLIEFLLENCAGKSMHYIEKVAISWVDEGILTVAQAKEKAAQNKTYYKILSALGCSKTNVTEVERECIDKWIKTYNLNIDIILEACKRTVMQTSKPSLNYTDRILTSWYKDGVKCFDDIIALDKARESKRAIEQNGQYIPKPAPPKVTKFTNIYTHNRDFDELEKLEREYIERTLKGGN